MFIAIEGIDGSGKTTQATLLFKRLSREVKCVLTSEPSNGIAGQAVRELLRGHQTKDPTFFQLLFTADRADHVAQFIAPKIKQKYTIITDRYLLSTVAYGTAEGANRKWLMAINSRFVQPNLTIILDIPARQALERVNDRSGNNEYFEHIGFQKKLRNEYLRLAEQYPNCKVIDGSADMASVSDNIYGLVKRKI